MFGWFRRAAACASRRNRATKPASRANGCTSTLIATVRSSEGSNPRKTSAIPPCPIRASTVYRSPIVSRSTRRIPSALALLLEVRLDDLFRDRSRHLSAGGLVPQVAAVEHDNAHGDARRLPLPGRRERCEP